MKNTNELEKLWNTKYQHTVEFFKKNGRWPKYHESYKGIPIGQWVGNARSRYKLGTLLPERISQLEKHGFPFEARNELWLETYNVLVDFWNTHQRWPKAYEVHQGYNLGKWCITQRSNLKNGILSQENKAHLDFIEFPWSMKSLVPNSQWYTSLEKIKRDYSNDKNLLNPRKKSWHCKWAKKQRELYDQGKLSELKIELLNELNFSILNSDKFLCEFDKEPRKKIGIDYEKKIKRLTLFVSKYNKWPKRQAQANEEDRAAVAYKFLEKKFNQGSLPVEYVQVLKSIKAPFITHSHHARAVI